MACDDCNQNLEPRFQQAPQFRGAFDDAVLANVTSGASVGIAAAALGQGMVGGAIIGGLAAGSWRGSGTGALLAGGLGGAFAGGALLLAGNVNPALRLGGGIGLAAGLVMLGLGATRSYRSIRGK